MAIKRFYSKKEKTGWKWDPSKKQYFSWGFDIRKSNGQRKRESGFGSRQLAEAAVSRIRLSEKSRRYELTDYESFPRLSDLARKRLNNLVDHAERIRSERVLNILNDCFARVGMNDPTIDQITTAHINLYTELRQSEKVKDETVNRELRVVAATFNQAKLFFSHLENWHPPKVRYLKVEKTRRERIVNSVEARGILFYLLKPQMPAESNRIFFSRKRAGLLFLLSAVTGARPGELVTLKDSDILPDLNTLRITGRKTRFKKAKTIRYFPMVDIVVKILNEALEIRADKNFIFSQRGTLTDTYYEQVRNACTAAGVVYGRKVAGGFIPYDLRHTATTLIMQSGADIETVASVTGQSHHTLWHYTHASNESIGRAVSVLENFANAALENNDLVTATGHGLDTKSKAKTVSLLN
jgi:integrase